MDDFDDFDPENRRPSILIAIIAAALSGGGRCYRRKSRIPDVGGIMTRGQMISSISRILWDEMGTKTRMGCGDIPRYAIAIVDWLERAERGEPIAKALDAENNQLRAKNDDLAIQIAGHEAGRAALENELRRRDTIINDMLASGSKN